MKELFFPAYSLFSGLIHIGTILAHSIHAVSFAFKNMPQPTEQPLLLFVINPVSGGKTKHNWEQAIREHFKEQPYRIEFFVLNNENDKDSLQHYIDTLDPAKLIAVGGDGTIKMLAEISRGRTMAILPAGSANGMAKELGISNDLAEALNVITNGVERPIDVIEVNEKHICIHLSDLGLNAQLVRYYEAHPKRGMLSYARFVLKALWNKQRFRVILDSDTEDRNRHAYMVVLANARMYGTGATINPDGDVSDGSFEIVILRQVSAIEAFKMLLKIRKLNSFKTEIIQVKEVKLTCNIPVHFQVDGEYLGKTKQVYAKILRSYLKIMVPAPAQA